jgi:hypothetical protein
VATLQAPAPPPIAHAPFDEHPHVFSGRLLPSQTNPAPYPWSVQLFVHDPH